MIIKDNLELVASAEETKEIGKELLDLLIAALSGDYTAWGKIVVKTGQFSMSAKTILFYYNFQLMLKELKYDPELLRLFLEFLNEEDKKEENSKRIIQLVDEMDSNVKIEALINLTKSASYKYISKREYFKLAKFIQQEIEEDLVYIRNRIRKGEIDENELTEEFVQSGLMYKTESGNYAYSIWSFYLDKYALSFANDKYKYNGERDLVPAIDEFPKRYREIIPAINGNTLMLNQK